jgi:cytoskeletal protein RodZ
MGISKIKLLLAVVKEKIEIIKDLLPIAVLMTIVLLGGIFLLGGVLGWIIKPGAKVNNQPATTVAKATVKSVVENPTSKQTKAADAVITEQTTIKTSGTVTIKPKATATAKESKYTIPLTGTATTTYIDSDTGATVGQGAHQVTGQANVTVQNDTVTADVTIDDTSQVAVTIKREPRKNEVGAYAGVAACGDPYTFIGGYYQRNLVVLQTKKADMALFARVSAERRWGADEDWEGKLMAGVRVEF